MFRNLDNLPTNLDILHINLVICSAQFNFISIVMPKYFADLLTENGLLLKSILTFGIGLVILGGNINGEDFLGLTRFFWHSSILVNSVNRNL